jgi:GTP-binding protein HflX
MPVRPKRFRSAQYGVPNANQGLHPARALVLAVQRPDVSDQAAEASRVELARLAHGLDIEVIGYVAQKRAAEASAYLGEGKLKEAAVALPEEERLVLVDDALTPGQMRALEHALSAEVLDRTALILRIFEQRAQTERARLEVELARLAYEVPRLRDDETLSARTGGGGGRGERGHTNVELAKQRMRQRSALLRRELEALQANDDARRDARAGAAFVVALVGYTNAGKSSWMRALTQADARVEDKLFATLDTTRRALAGKAGPPVEVVDTVGFIQRLPHELVASFHATLEEARHAHRVLLLVDASDPDFRAQLAVTRATLEEIEARAEVLLVLNKADRLSREARYGLRLEYPEALIVSAHDAEDAARVREAIRASLEPELEEALFELPFARGELTAEIKARAQVVQEEWTEHGAVLRVRAPHAALQRWRASL